MLHQKEPFNKNEEFITNTCMNHPEGVKFVTTETQKHAFKENRESTQIYMKQEGERLVVDLSGRVPG